LNVIIDLISPNNSIVNKNKLSELKLNKVLEEKDE